VPIAVVVLVASVLLLLAPVRPLAQRTPKARRQFRFPRHTGWTLVGVVVVILLARFGLEWLALVSGVLLALARGAGAFIALLPLLRELRGERASAGQSQGGRSRWQAEPGAEEAKRPGRMTRREALEILGLDSGATPEDVQREYRRLIKKIHPDLGGSSYLAAKVNEAKDVLS
jgi:hypothetical protein